MYNIVNKYDLFIFDLDDTLVYTEKYHFESWLHVLQEYISTEFNMDYTYFTQKFHSVNCDAIKNYLLNELNIKEEKWINNFPKNKLYNKNFYITDLSGDKNPFFGKKHKLESKKKMSNWKKENYLGEKNPNFGKRCTNEQKKINVLKNSKTKLKEKDVIEIKNLLLEGSLKDKEIASKFGVNRTVITRISNGKRWTTITGGAIISNERRGLKNIKI